MYISCEESTHVASVYQRYSETIVQCFMLYIFNFKLHSMLIVSNRVIFFFSISISSFKMIGLAQGPGPCVSRRAAIESSDIETFIAVKSPSLITSSYFLSLCVFADNEIEVLKFVGPLTAEAPISRSAWSQ